MSAHEHRHAHEHLHGDPHAHEHQHGQGHGHGHQHDQGHDQPGSATCPAPVPLVLGAQPPLPAETPVFSAPWQAQAFAMTLQLHQRGLFSWPEWAAALTSQINAAQAAGDADLGDTYWQHWLAALEQLVTQRGAGSADELNHTAQAWATAAGRTPHGAPITLVPGDYPPTGR